MNDVYDRLVKLLTTGFGLRADEVSPELSFNDLELDSLALVELAMTAQEEFGVKISDDELSPQDTVAQAVEIIQGKAVRI
nr:acyl carrier protein [Micromonospora sp. DSM 115978]